MSKLDYTKTINAKKKQERNELIKTFMAGILTSLIPFAYDKGWSKRQIAIEAQLQAEEAADAFLERAGR